MKLRIGHGYDVHRLAPGRPLVIGGVTIDWHLGLEGHSDADVLIHAVCDALLGAAGLGDIGRHFPPSDSQYKNADSRTFLCHVRDLLGISGWVVGNIDVTLIAEKPKIAPYVAAMVTNLESDLKAESGSVNIKATTTEGLGFCGREEGIACHAVATIVAA